MAVPRSVREEEELKPYQVELLKLQRYLEDENRRMIVLFEGRDAAGKGGTIRRVTRYMNEKHYRVVALGKPTEEQRTQWYFQRYVAQFPSGGEIVLFDRSWYNRAGVEMVMGFCTAQEHTLFLRQTPIFEQMLIDDGIILRKYWFSVSDEEQLNRFKSRRKDPLRRWKLSPMDLESLDRWEAYTAAKEAMFELTDKKTAPWITVKSNDKKRGRINALRAFLNQFDYEGKDPSVVFAPDETIVRRARHAEGD